MFPRVLVLSLLTRRFPDLPRAPTDSLGSGSTGLPHRNTLAVLLLVVRACACARYTCSFVLLFRGVAAAVHESVVWQAMFMIRTSSGRMNYGAARQPAAEVATDESTKSSQQPPPSTEAQHAPPTAAPHGPEGSMAPGRADGDEGKANTDSSA